MYVGYWKNDELSLREELKLQQCWFWKKTFNVCLSILGGYALKGWT